MPFTTNPVTGKKTFPLSAVLAIRPLQPQTCYWHWYRRGRMDKAKKFLLSAWIKVISQRLASEQQQLFASLRIFQIFRLTSGYTPKDFAVQCFSCARPECAGNSGTAETSPLTVIRQYLADEVASTI